MATFMPVMKESLFATGGRLPTAFTVTVTVPVAEPPLPSLMV